MKIKVRAKRTSRRGRPATPITPTHRIDYVETKRKSNAGVGYTYYKPTKVKI